MSTTKLVLLVTAMVCATILAATALVVRDTESSPAPAAEVDFCPPGRECGYTPPD